MAEDIQLLANTLMYDSALRPGNAAVASAMLHLPHHTLPGLPPWLAQATPFACTLLEIIAAIAIGWL